MTTRMGVALATATTLLLAAISVATGFILAM